MNHNSNIQRQPRSRRRGPRHRAQQQGATGHQSSSSNHHQSSSSNYHPVAAKPRVLHDDSQINESIRYCQRLTRRLARRDETILDRNWLPNREIWNTDIKMDDPMDDLHVLIVRTIKRWRGLDYDRYHLTHFLDIWAVKTIESPNGLAAYCIKWDDFVDPIYAQMAKVGDEIHVRLGNAALNLQQLLDFLAKGHDVGKPNYSFQQGLWEQTGQRFRWFDLPNDIKWKVMEEIVEPVVFKPTPTKLTALAGPFMWPRKEEEIPHIMSPEGLRTMLRVFDLVSTPVEYEMICKADIRANTFSFNKPFELYRFLENCLPRCLPEIRTIRLSFKNDEFISFWGGDILPNGRKNKFAKYAKMLGELCLYALELNFDPFRNTAPKYLDNSMMVRNYFPNPVPYGCHEKVLKYICGLASRHLHETKRLKLHGIFIRPSWQHDVDRMFSFARNGEHSDSSYSRKEFDRIVANPKMEALIENEKKEAEGGVGVSSKEKKKADPVPSAGTSVHSAAVDLPERDEDDDGMLWPCECYVPCNDQSFNARDAPEE